MIVRIKGRENSRIDKYPDAVVMGFPKCGTGTLNFLGENNFRKTINQLNYRHHHHKFT